MRDTRILFYMAAFVALLIYVALLGLAQGDSPTERILHSFPVHHTDRDEPQADRDARLHLMASLLEELIKSRKHRGIALTIGRHESYYAADVCAGERLGDKGRAFGCFQSWNEDRSGGYRGQVERLAEDIRQAENYCRALGYTDVAAVFSLYATGKTCVRPMPKRVRTYHRVMSQL